MASTYSPILRTELIGAGDQAGTWGSTTNSNFQYIFESAIAGYVAVTVSPTSNNQVLTYVNGPSASAALDQSIYGILKLNAGTLGANFNIFAPPVSKTYVVWNNTSYTATFYNSTVIGNTTVAGSGAVIPAGAKVMVWSDGTNFWGIDSTTGNLSVAGNISVAGNETVTGTLGVTGVATFTAQPIMSSLTAFSAVATDASKGLVSVANTGTGSNVLAVSPALTGTPTAPTATAGTNTTQIATTAFVLANGIPSGAIVMWSGSIASIPSGWLLCNGSSGTPDLRDRFVVGAGSTYAVAATGGTADAVVVSHTHTATSTVTDPGHLHTSYGSGAFNGGGDGGAYGQNGTNYGPRNLVPNTTGISVSTTNTTTGVSGTNANLPPYYALAYIMKA
jgi:hypothetical protein